jgi:hypothetical protein
MYDHAHAKFDSTLNAKTRENKKKQREKILPSQRGQSILVLFADKF